MGRHRWSGRSGRSGQGGGRLVTTVRAGLLAVATGLAALAFVGTGGATGPASAAPAASAASVGSSAAAWPTETGAVKLSATVTVTGTFDGHLQRYWGLGDGSQSESQPALFVVQDGGTIKNVIIGTPAGDGIHCQGSCTIQNVWWLDVGEDAATFKGASSSTQVLVAGGGARKAADKVFQHNGGGSVTIQNFQVEDFGKLYRSCGNCKTQHPRTVTIRNVTATAPGKSLAGINANYGDRATFSGITLVGDPAKKVSICDRYTGNSNGSEPKKIGSGPDGTYCRYSPSDLTYR